MYFQILTISLVLCLSSGAKLPSNFKKCNRKQTDFDECLFKAVEQAVKQLNAPIKEIGLPSIDPLLIPSLTIAAGTSAVALEQRYTNISFMGFSNVSFSKIEINFDANMLSVEGTIPEVLLTFNYDFHGNILMLPIDGRGPGRVTIVQPKFDFSYHFEEYVKRGRKYMKITDQRFHWVPELLKFKFENLVGGDRTLGETINRVFNDNWQAILDDAGPSCDTALGQVFAAMSNGFLAKVPVSELFGDE